MTTRRWLLAALLPALLAACGQPAPTSAPTQGGPAQDAAALARRSQEMGLDPAGAAWVAQQSAAWIAEHAPQPGLSVQMAREDCGLPFVAGPGLRYAYQICYTTWPFYYVKNLGAWY